jgi:hypothetical protein
MKPARVSYRWSGWDQLTSSKRKRFDDLNAAREFLERLSRRGGVGSLQARLEILEEKGRWREVQWSEVPAEGGVTP